MRYMFPGQLWPRNSITVSIVTCFQQCIVKVTYQVKGSGHQVKSKSDVHSGTGFELEDRAVSTVLVRMFSTF